MTLALNLLYFIASGILLVISGIFLVKSLSKIASFLKISEFAAAFIIMAASTSLPELFVGITSALNENPTLALGTVIGSNISDLTLVGGIMILLGRKIKVGGKFIKKDGFYMFFIALIPLVLMLIGKQLSRIDGAILILIYLLYNWKLIKERKLHKKVLENHINRWHVIGSVFLFLISLALLFFSAEFVVKYGTLIAVDLLLPPILIGLFFVAIGTSLPELAFETSAVIKGHPQLSLGDLIGSVITNSTLVLGVTALIFPISGAFVLFLTSSLFMIIITFLFATMIAGGKLYWQEGIALIMLYMLFLFIEFNIIQHIK